MNRGIARGNALDARCKVAGNAFVCSRRRMEILWVDAVLRIVNFEEITNQYQRDAPRSYVRDDERGHRRTGFVPEEHHESRVWILLRNQFARCLDNGSVKFSMTGSQHE